jgi:hypothetical protein
VATYNQVQFVFDRTLLSPDEDVAIMTCHIREVVAGAPDVIPITDQGRTDFVNNVSSWWAAIEGHISSNVVFRELRFYDVPSSPGVDMGPPVKVQPFGAPGTSVSNSMPPQCAISVTLKTDKRRTWGRMYLPNVTFPMLDSKGRLVQTVATELCTAWHFLTTRAGTGAALCVFSRKEWTHHDPQQIQVDDIVDVIRSRRYSAAHFRQTLSAG